MKTMYPVSACKKFSKHHLSIECSCLDFEDGQHVWLKFKVFLWQRTQNKYLYLSDVINYNTIEPSMVFINLLLGPVM